MGTSLRGNKLLRFGKQSDSSVNNPLSISSFQGREVCYTTTQHTIKRTSMHYKKKPNILYKEGAYHK